MADGMQHKVVIVTGAGSAGSGRSNGTDAATLDAREGAKVVAIDSLLQAAGETGSLMASEGGTCIAGKAGSRWVAFPDRASSASKAAILAMTSDITRHDAAQGIGDSCVWSGLMQTPFTVSCRPRSRGPT